MARPQSEARLGFYPFPPPCLPMLAQHLHCRDPDSDASTITILDPCAGEGVALGHLARHLGVPAQGVYAIELDAGRAAILHDQDQALAGANVLAPCSFTGTKISHNCFSLVYVNPPYASEIGGGRREELTFLVRAMNHLIPGGVLVAVLPEPTVFEWGGQPEAMRRTLSCRLANVTVSKLPADHREYRELVVIGVKRTHAVPAGDGMLGREDWWNVRDTLPILDEWKTPVYEVPPGLAPKFWKKTDFTAEELTQRVKLSPLNRAFDRDAPAPRRRRPPLPLARGHIALILASGQLDGLVCPEGEPPHVVRGTARKETFRDIAKSETTVDDKGNISEKEVLAERTILTVRTIDASGTIRTLTDHTPEEAAACPTATDTDESPASARPARA